jgi:hypothetical protein
MSLADEITRQQNEDTANREIQRSKCGNYTGEKCPNCKRERVMMGSDQKRRCEKCCWCLEDNDYDHDLLDSMK